MKKQVDVYAHGSKENLLEIGEQLGLTGEVLRMFSFAADDVKLTLSVDMETGVAEIVAVDGRDLEA